MSNDFGKHERDSKKNIKRKDRMNSIEDQNFGINDPSKAGNSKYNYNNTGTYTQPHQDGNQI